MMIGQKMLNFPLTANFSKCLVFSSSDFINLVNPPSLIHIQSPGSNYLKYCLPRLLKTMKGFQFIILQREFGNMANKWEITVTLLWCARAQWAQMAFFKWIDNFRMIEEAMNTRRYSRPIAVERTFYEIYVPSGFWEYSFQ